MPCSATLDLSLATNDQPMDAAIYSGVTDNHIIGVRGGRVFKCDPVTGLIISSIDYQQLGFGPATIAYAPVIDLCYATCMVTPHYSVAGFASARTLFKINHKLDPMQVVQSFDFVATFGLPLNNAAFESGIMVMKPFSSAIFAMCFSSTINPALHLIDFAQIDPTINTTQTLSLFNYPSFGVGNVGAEVFMFWASQDADTINTFGWAGTGFNQRPADVTKGYYATEYVPSQNRIYVTREFQFIDIYTNAAVPVYVSTINTGITNFNAVNIKLNPNDGLLYIAGGASNTVLTLNPVGNILSAPKVGFDLPWDFVFTPSKKFAVQQGATALKEII